MHGKVKFIAFIDVRSSISKEASKVTSHGLILRFFCLAFLVMDDLMESTLEIPWASRSSAIYCENENEKHVLSSKGSVQERKYA